MRKMHLWLLVVTCFFVSSQSFSMISVEPSPRATTAILPKSKATFKKPVQKILLAIKAYKVLNIVKRAEGSKKPVLGTLALVSGILGLVLLFTVGGIGLLFSLAAIILGLIAPKKRGEKGRTEAIVGLVLGAATLLLLLVAVIALTSSSWWR